MEILTADFRLAVHIPIIPTRPPESAPSAAPNLLLGSCLRYQSINKYYHVTCEQEPPGIHSRPALQTGPLAVHLSLSDWHSNYQGSQKHRHLSHRPQQYLTLVMIQVLGHCDSAKDQSEKGPSKKFTIGTERKFLIIFHRTPLHPPTLYLPYKVSHIDHLETHLLFCSVNSPGESEPYETGQTLKEKKDSLK